MRFPRSLFGIATLSLVVSGVVAVASPPACAGPLACGDDVATMVELEAKAADHFRFGLMAASVFRTPERLPGEVVGSGGYGDSGGLWTGVYLGGEAMRYAVAKHYLDRDAKVHGESAGKGESDGAPGHTKDLLTDEERAFWTAQRDEALSRVRQMVAAFHRSVNIAAAWKTTTKVPPGVHYDPAKNPDPTSYRHLADVGGGVIHGEPGMLMRACTPVGEPLGIQDYGEDDRVFGPFQWTDGKDYWCEGSPSRDTYAGVTFGMLTTFDLVSRDDRAMRDTLRADLLAMGDFLVKYGWNYPRPHGFISAKHDFDGAVSPLFVYVPMARLNMANAVRHVVADGNPADRQRWDAIWAEEFASQSASGALAASMEIDSAQPNDGYYKFNLHHLTGFNLMRTTTGVERDLFLRSFAVMDKTTRDDINAHFEAITYSMTGDRQRVADAVTHVREWVEYRANIEDPVRNSARCGTGLACVPEDQYEVAVEQAPGGSVTWFPGAPDAPPVSESAGLRAARPLPVPLRPPTDFLWQRPPTALDGQEGATWREPGIDYLAPYWMIRYLTEVASPASTPFPEWVGPAHL